MAVFLGTPDADTFNGTPDDDVFEMSLGGDDTVSGGRGNDIFNFGAELTAADTIAGDLGNDTLSLNGDYSAGLVFAATTMTGVENITLTTGNSYDLTLDDANVAAGRPLEVDASGLLAENTLRLDGKSETDGAFKVLGGGDNDVVLTGLGADRFSAGDGNDTFKGGGGNDEAHGGAGNDTLIGQIGVDELFGDEGDDFLTGSGGTDELTGGDGADTFIYANVNESTNQRYDTLVGFDGAEDRIDLNVTVTGIDPKLTTGSLSDGHTYVSDFETAITSDVLAANHAVVWIPDAGTDAGDIYVVVDANGVAGFQAGADYILEIEDPQHPGGFGLDTFI